MNHVSPTQNHHHSICLAPSQHGALWLQAGQHPQGRTHMSAASGLVRSGAQLFVVSDDELHLGVFTDTLASEGTLQPGHLVRLLDGDLPVEKSARKRAKPDLETLTLLPPLPGCSCGALLALGSGSRANRETGVLMALGAPGVLNGRTAPVRLAALYAPLRKHFSDLNIEGAWVSSGELMLLQRGNKSDARSACIRFDWNLMAPWLAGLQPLPPPVKSIQIINLGSADGVPLSLTDGVPLPNGEWMFSAVAEDTLDSVADGQCVASALGVVTAQGQVRRVLTLQGAPKVEGIALQTEAEDWVVTMVTDPDDPTVASQCLTVRVPRST